MMTALSRMLVALAAQSLSSRRRDWADAMQGELAAATADGRPLGFACGCLWAAWRTLPGEREGRIAIGAHALAIGWIVPTAAVSLWSAWLGLPYLGLGRVGFRGFVAGHSDQLPLLHAGNWCGAPALTLLLLLWTAGHMALAWFLLERNRSAACAALQLNAAALTSLAIVTALLSLDPIPLLLPFVALVTETLAVLALTHGDSEAESGSRVGDPAD